MQVQFSWKQAVLFSGLWTVFEWVRSWLLTGFPWLLQGYSLLDTPIRSWAPITGVYGLSLLMVLTATLITSITSSVYVTTDIPSRNQALIALSTVIMFWIVSVPLDKIHWTRCVNEISFSAIQGNIPQSLKWNPRHVQKTLDTYYELTSNEWQQDLIIWPENAIPVFYSNAQKIIAVLSNIAAKNGSILMLGIPVDDNRDNKLRYYNSILILNASESRYYKQKLVPFGEYVPLEFALRNLIDFFNLPMSLFSSGTSDQQKLTIAGILIAAYICYEVVYPDFAAEQARDTGLLINISNDTWFGHSFGPKQHFQIARMRSLETGRYMIRATNNGMTALINNKGEIVDSIERFKYGVLRGTAKVMTGNTPFMITGSWPILMISSLLIILVIKRSTSSEALL